MHSRKNCLSKAHTHTHTRQSAKQKQHFSEYRKKYAEKLGQHLMKKQTFVRSAAPSAMTRSKNRKLLFELVSVLWFQLYSEYQRSSNGTLALIKPLCNLHHLQPSDKRTWWIYHLKLHKLDEFFNQLRNFCILTCQHAVSEEKVYWLRLVMAV